VKIKRSPDQTGISVSMSKQELLDIDNRSKALGLPRSKYLVLLAKRDIACGGGLILEANLPATLADAVSSSLVNEAPLAVPVSYGSPKQAARRSKVPRVGGSKKKV
jgi:hypothetical protein